MNCPFLREAQVRSCQASHVRKLIVDGIGTAADVTCLTEAHVNCASFHEQHAVSDGPARCPFLHERLMQYCGVQAVPKMVPYSELSRCGSESFRYCELYLDIARPRRDQGSEQSSGVTPRTKARSGCSPRAAYREAASRCGMSRSSADGRSGGPIRCH